MHHKAGSAGSSVTEGTDVPRMAGAFTEREHPIGDRQHAYQLASRKTLPCSAPAPPPRITCNTPGLFRSSNIVSDFAHI